MVNAINAASVINQTTATKEADIKKLVKYVNNESLQDIPDTFSSTTKSALGSAGLFEGIPLVKFLMRNKKLNGTFKNANLKILGEADKNALNNLLKGEDKLTKRISDFIQHTNQSKYVFMDEKAAVKSKLKAQKLSDKAAKLAEKATNKPNSKLAKKLAEKAKTKSQDAIANCISQTEKATNSRMLVTANATKGSTKLGKVGSALNKVTKGKFGKVSKFMKSSGAGIMLVFSGVAEAATEVVPTFKELGKEKGLKQLGKSAIKVVGDTAGFIAGEQAGMALGSAIGTAICPGIGTVVGGVCGFVGGMLGSFVAGKITKAITGKSEREKAKEQQENENSKQIANDIESLENLKNSAIAKIQENAQLSNGELSEDDKIALQSLENLDSTNPFNA